MNKKEYLSKILAQLEPVWSLAAGLRILVDDWNLDDNLLDTLIEAVQWAVHTAKSDLAKKKLEKWLEAMEKMKEMEKKSLEEDEKDLAELDNMLENF